MITLWVLACILYFSLHIENAMTPFLKVQNDIQTNEYEPTAHATFTYSRSQCGFWHGRPLSPTSSSTLSLGITGTALKWVELYLSNQLQHIFSGGWQYQASTWCFSTLKFGSPTIYYLFSQVIWGDKWSSPCGPCTSRQYTALLVLEA